MSKNQLSVTVPQDYHHIKTELSRLRSDYHINISGFCLEGIEEKLDKFLENEKSGLIPL